MIKLFSLVQRVLKKKKHDKEHAHRDFKNKKKQRIKKNLNKKWFLNFNVSNPKIEKHLN